jgi:hypothetical protein
MSLCDMDPHQIAVYINTWAIVIAVVVSNLGVWAVMKASATTLSRSLEIQPNTTKGNDDAEEEAAHRNACID